jgi:hypothetical protein
MEGSVGRAEYCVKGLARLSPSCRRVGLMVQCERGRGLKPTLSIHVAMLLDFEVPTGRNRANGVADAIFGQWQQCQGSVVVFLRTAFGFLAIMKPQSAAPQTRI